jgi:hypothetical protein
MEAAMIRVRWCAFLVLSHGRAGLSLFSEVRLRSDPT